MPGRGRGCRKSVRAKRTPARYVEGSHGGTSHGSTTQSSENPDRDVITVSRSELEALVRSMAQRQTDNEVPEVSIVKPPRSTNTGTDTTAPVHRRDDPQTQPIRLQTHEGSSQQLWSHAQHTDVNNIQYISMSLN